MSSSHDDLYVTPCEVISRQTLGAFDRWCSYGSFACPTCSRSRQDSRNQVFLTCQDNFFLFVNYKSTLFRGFIVDLRLKSVVPGSSGHARTSRSVNAMFDQAAAALTDGQYIERLQSALQQASVSSLNERLTERKMASISTLQQTLQSTSVTIDIPIMNYYSMFITFFFFV